MANCDKAYVRWRSAQLVFVFNGAAVNYFKLINMESKIKLTKNNDNRNLSDLEWIDEFYRFLQGDMPKGIELGSKLKLSKNKAFSIIWYLQEHFSIFPDTIEKCSECGDLYDSYSAGYHSEVFDKFYCEGCCPPFIDEKEEKTLARRAKKQLKNKTK